MLSCSLNYKIRDTLIYNHIPVVFALCRQPRTLSNFSQNTIFFLNSNSAKCNKVSISPKPVYPQLNMWVFKRTGTLLMMMMMMNCFCGMVDWRKAFSLISSWDHCQRSSPSRISDSPQAGFEPALKPKFRLHSTHNT